MTGDHGNADAMRRNKKFLQALFGPAHDTCHVCAVAGDPSKKDGYWGGGRALATLKTIGDKTNNYFCISLFQGERRRINEFRELVCLAVDDVGPKLEPELVELLLGPPTWIVESSLNNFQWGYRLDEPLTDAATAADLIKRVRVALTGKGGKDPGMEAVTRYVRLPTGLNLKKSLGQPFRVRLRRMDPSIGLRSNTISSILGLPEPLRQRDNSMVASPPGDDPAGEPILRRSSVNKIKGSHATLDDDDAILKSLRKLGLVLDGPRETAMGWGFDIRCPWVGEHTDRAETGTVYVAGAGKFKCQHGHCSDRTVEDVRGRLDEMLRDNGHAGGLIAEEFDVVDPEKVPAPPQGLKPKPGAREIEFFDRFVTIRGRNLFYDLDRSNETTSSDIDERWARRLVNALPRIKTGKVEKPIAPSKWLKQAGRMVNGLIGWPGMPRIVAPDPKDPGTLYVNTWKPMKRPLAKVAECEVDENAIRPWLKVYWHIVGDKPLANWEVGETLLDWLALVLGDQSLKAGWHVIITGQHGVGKDSIILPVAVALGARWAQTIQSQQIAADFNEWAGKRLVQISETRQNTRGSTTAHDVMAILKAIFDNTRQWITVNPKYAPKHDARNVVMGWFTSNESEPLRLEDGDRRFLVLDRTETKPMDALHYARLHAWLTTVENGMTGMERVAEFLLRRWETMDYARRAALFGVAPLTADKLALLARLKSPIADWMERCIERDAIDPLSFPDIVSAAYVHQRLYQAIRTGGEGLPGGTQLPALTMIGTHLKDIHAVVLNGGKQVRWRGSSPVVLWAVRSASQYMPMNHFKLARVMERGFRSTTPKTIN